MRRSAAHTVLVLVLCSAAWAAESPVAVSPGADRVEVIEPVTPILIDKTLLDLPPAPVRQPDDPVRDIHPRQITNPDALLRPVPSFVPQPDPLLDLQLRTPKKADRTFTGPDINVAGMDPSCCPPDTVGEIGSTHYIQMINGVGGAGASLQVFSKATGAPAFLLQ
ncbi:MAG: hypothetical protein IH936_06915 [Acidobacteria bacterium]|nr:hypothetical protein [Acidobacteriota bacterium]